MSLRKKANGIWYADEYTPRGRRIRPSSGTRDEAKAREWYAKLLDDLWRQKSLDEKPRRTWDDDELVDTWVVLEQRGVRDFRDVGDLHGGLCGVNGIQYGQRQTHVTEKPGTYECHAGDASRLRPGGRRLDGMEYDGATLSDPHAPANGWRVRSPEIP